MKRTSSRSVSKGRPPASNGDRRRSCILDNALTLFAEQGINGTTVAQIAEASGVTSAMVHYYFRNRDGLLDSLVEERLAPRIQYIWDCVSEDKPGEPAQIVEKIIMRLLEVVDEMPQLPQLWNREIFHANGCLRERLMPYFPFNKFDNFCRILNVARQKGTLNPKISPDLVVISAVSLIMVPLAAQKYLSDLPGGPVLEKERVGKHALALILDGMFPQKRK